MKKFAFCFLSLAIFSLSAFAAEDDQLPANFLGAKHSLHTNHAGGLHGKGNIPTPHGFPVGVDTLVNFTGHYEAQGVYFDGTAHHIWEYSMVGNPPAHGGTTVINAPVVPVIVDLRNYDGSPRFVNGKRLISMPAPFLQPFMDGPVFGTAHYSSSPVDTQITDAEQRATFGNKARSDWHTLLAPSIKTTRTMVLLRGTYRFALNADGTCCAFILVDEGTFGSELFPPAKPDNSTIIGAAEVAGEMTTKDISTFMFPNTYLYQNGDPNQCCVLGYHTFDIEAGDAANHNQPRFYVMNYSSWITPGLFGPAFEDVTAFSHEMAEIFNDPFVAYDGLHNVTPFTQNPRGDCQDVLEVGDVIEDLPNSTYPVTIGGYTYHPQTIALLPWFAFEKNSTAINNAYSYPDETVLTSLSTPQPLNCGQ
jgi:hypothetical protein